MIDTDKYEGHTEGPWILMKDGSYERYIALEPDDDYYEGEARVVLHHSCERGFRASDAQLIADAPLLLEEVKRLTKELELYKTRYLKMTEGMDWQEENEMWGNEE